MSKRPTRTPRPKTWPLQVNIWGPVDEETGERECRSSVLQTRGTMSDIVATLLRALRVSTKRDRARVILYTGGEVGKYGPGAQVCASLKNEAGREIRVARSEALAALKGAIISRATPENFVRHFTDRNVFTGTPGTVQAILANRTARMKREDALLEAFNRLPAAQQTALLRALRVGPAIVLQSRGVR